MTSAKPFLFVHCSGPSHTHLQEKGVKRDVRRHVMVDIGKSRRKATRNPRVDVVTPSSAREAGILDPMGPVETHAGEESVKPTSTDDVALSGPLPWPFWEQHPLMMLERQWEMDMFSAYGIAFVVSEGKNLIAKRRGPGTGGFWFPFAFGSSVFLHHFQDVLTSPEMLASITVNLGKRFETIALRRVSGTISCLGRILSDTDRRRVTAKDVIRGVLACICYNLVSSDFSQARLHLEGLERLVSARGGIETLQDDMVLVLMIFWVDVTASLLFNSKPRFSLPFQLLQQPSPPWRTELLPSRLASIARIINVAESRYGAHVILCLEDLRIAASQVERIIATSTKPPWQHEETIGLNLHPIAHRLLDILPDNEATISGNSIAEALGLGQLIWIILVKRQCRAYPGSAEPYASALLDLLSNVRAWDKGVDILPAHLWLLVLCALGCSGTDKQAPALGIFQHAVKEWRPSSLDEIMVHVRQMPWISVFDSLFQDLEWH